MKAGGGQIAQSKIYLSHSGDHPFMWTNPDEFRDIADLFLTSKKKLSQVSIPIIISTPERGLGF